LLRSVVLATNVDRERRRPSSLVLSGTSSRSASRLAVSVPVLSVHSTSTRLSDSTALACWTSAPNRTRRTAPSAYATAIDTNRPFGINPARTEAWAIVSPGEMT
jgi:hypothetical protein